MTTTQNTSSARSSFNQGVADARTITTLSDFLNEPTTAKDISAYIKGALAGLSMELGRAQVEMDLAIENDEDTTNLENHLADLYEMIEDLALNHMR